jgi:hypothetical protein
MAWVESIVEEYVDVAVDRALFYVRAEAEGRTTLYDVVVECFCQHEPWHEKNDDKRLFVGR